MIGYAPRKSGRPDSCDAAISPYDSAWLPVMFRYVPGRELRGLHLVRDRERLRRLAERVPRAQRLQVRLGDLGPLRELRRDERLRGVDRASVQPRHEPEREHVLRTLRLARRHAFDVLERADRERRQRHGVHLELVERPVLERVRRVARLLEIAVVERVRVHDQRAALRQILEIRHQRRRVHRDEDVRRVTRRQDVVVGEVELEAGDTRQRAGRRANLGGKVGERRDVVAEHRRLRGELRAGELHAVAGVAREADHDGLALLDDMGHSGRCSTALQRVSGETTDLEAFARGGTRRPSGRSFLRCRSEKKLTYAMKRSSSSSPSSAAKTSSKVGRVGFRAVLISRSNGGGSLPHKRPSSIFAAYQVDALEARPARRSSRSRSSKSIIAGSLPTWRSERSQNASDERPVLADVEAEEHPLGLWIREAVDRLEHGEPTAGTQHAEERREPRRL